MDRMILLFNNNITRLLHIQHTLDLSDNRLEQWLDEIKREFPQPYKKYK
jgi:hypothetical protein